MINKRRLATACLELRVEAEERAVAAIQPAGALHDAALERHAELLVIGSSHRGALAATPAGTEGHLLRGRPVHVLGEATGQVDLMLVGSRGRGSAGRLILGSTSRHMTHHAACPLIVLPRP